MNSAMCMSDTFIVQSKSEEFEFHLPNSMFEFRNFILGIYGERMFLPKIGKIFNFYIRLTIVSMFANIKGYQ